MPKVTETTLREQLSDATRMMVMADLLDYSGHLSARIPDTDRVLIQPRDASRAGLTADEILVVDLEGRVLEGKGPAPTETANHGSSRPGAASAVAHSRNRAGTANSTPGAAAPNARRARSTGQVRTPVRARLPPLASFATARLRVP